MSPPKLLTGVEGAVPSASSDARARSRHSDRTTSSTDWRGRVEATRRGLPVELIDQAIGSGRLTLGEIDRVVLPRKTLSHRRRIGRLTPEQSDRLARVLALVGEAEAVFGSEDKAGQWLRRATAALAGERPLDLLDTSAGSREVERLLGQIGHGIAA